VVNARAGCDDQGTLSGSTGTKERPTAVYIPFLIFFARVLDVSLGTMRIIVTINGNRWLATVLGFFELIIWSLALGGMVIYLSNPFAVLAFAAGFSAGTYVGLMIEDRVALGFRSVQIINANPEVQVAPPLREAGFRVTILPGYGQFGPVEVAVLVIRRRSLRRVFQIVDEVAPRAFISVERADRPSAEMFGTLRDDRRKSRLFGLVRK
jgi:uncharacterized protein YebE (UPF0316 family)